MSEPKPPPWAIHPRHDPRVVVQVGELWCGPAACEMLLRDRGFAVGQAEVAAQTPTPAPAVWLARAMTDITHQHWIGGSLADPPEPMTLKYVAALREHHGTWAALLLPAGASRMGHWVVVDAVQDGAILIRDPEGWAYAMDFAEFARLWTTTAVVLERTA
jgi:ABC-type bacteriocin/lantibiotic exporter with double-glycine peptidase domain